LLPRSLPQYQFFHPPRGHLSLVKFFHLIVLAALGAAGPIASEAQIPVRRSGPPPRRAADLIHRQEPINVSPRLLARLTPTNARVRVSLSKQRAYLMLGDEIVVDTPISSGKRSRPTPAGSYHILEKDKGHHSSVYGDFRDSAGRIVRRGVSMRIDSAPSGTHFVGAEMTFFMRLTDDGVGMHIGFLPGYAASHGCIRMPSVAAEMFFNHVKVGTPVVVTE
ncbi:MAG: L,D-transpeptidase family protein, partial [Chthoniobacterales bacterium]